MGHWSHDAACPRATRHEVKPESVLVVMLPCWTQGSIESISLRLGARRKCRPRIDTRVVPTFVVSFARHAALSWRKATPHTKFSEVCFIVEVVARETKVQ